MAWVLRGIGALGLLVVGWCCVTAWPAIVHGHPLYGVLLVLTIGLSVFAILKSFRPRDGMRTWRKVLGIVGVVAFAAWIGLMAWLRPFPALEPALAAMESSSTVVVTESPTQIVLTPTAGASSTGVFFQPGAKVDARAYAAILRPLAEAGYTVVIPKQPLGIAFLATNAFESTRDANPQITDWFVGGHSLGGTVAAMDAEAHSGDASAPVKGLILYASYPASDMSETLSAKVLSVSGTEDGLATPADIEASRANLPKDAIFTPIEGGVHAFFGDYGPQPGDGTPTISQDEARQLIARNTLIFVSGVQRNAGD
jgi:predicted alpha/beta-hydrolase family hydrolase